MIKYAHTHIIIIFALMQCAIMLYIAFILHFNFLLIEIRAELQLDEHPKSITR